MKVCSVGGTQWKSDSSRSFAFVPRKCFKECVLKGCVETLGKDRADYIKHFLCRKS